MKLAVRIGVLLLFLSVAPSGASAQRRFSQLKKLDDAIEKKIADVMPGWKRRVIEPASLNTTFVNDKVSISQWRHGNKGVRIVLAQYDSDEEASAVLQRFATHMRTDKRIPGLGDEAYQYGISGGIAFRRNNLLVYVTAGINKDMETDEERIKNSATRVSEFEETANISREVARHVAVVIAQL